MNEVVTWVSGRIDPDRRNEVEQEFGKAIEAGIPPGIAQTMLIRDGDELGVVTTWRSREDLEATMASPEEPFARRLIREAGGRPAVRVFEVVTRSGQRPQGG